MAAKRNTENFQRMARSFEPRPWDAEEGVDLITQL
jgi:hypothetical protein